MFGLGRKKKRSAEGTTSTFVDATGGGWSDSPEVVSTKGGSQADFVDQTLERAHAYALEHEVPVGSQFEFIITDIPVGISSPHEIIFGLMMEAHRYGLSADAIHNEKISFIRMA
jgi:hypothetical protein